jgi:hypothetical protein
VHGSLDETTQLRDFALVGEGTPQGLNVSVRDCHERAT